MGQKKPNPEKENNNNQATAVAAELLVLSSGLVGFQLLTRQAW